MLFLSAQTFSQFSSLHDFRQTVGVYLLSFPVCDMLGNAGQVLEVDWKSQLYSLISSYTDSKLPLLHPEPRWAALSACNCAQFIQAFLPHSPYSSVQMCTPHVCVKIATSALLLTHNNPLVCCVSSCFHLLSPHFVIFLPPPHSPIIFKTLGLTFLGKTKTLVHFIFFP